MNARSSHRQGVVHDMPSAEYHSGPEMSCSVLHALAKSPAHAWALHLDPAHPVREPTPAMRAGTLAHCAVLEPDALPLRYAVRPADMDGRTKEGKAWLASVASSGLEIVTHEQHQTAMLQAAAVRAVPELASALATGSAEVSAFWRDDGTGTPCRCRPDWVHPLADGRVILLDLKTTTDASPEAFSRTVWTFGYHRQAAWYSRGYEAASGQLVAAFVFAAVTNEYPFIAVPYLLDDEALQRGHTDCDRLLALYAECAASSRWPAFGDGVQLLTLPAWAK